MENLAGIKNIKKYYRHMIAILFISILGINSVQAVRNYLGSAGFGPSEGSFFDIAISTTTNVPYITFVNMEQEGKASVMKRAGNDRIYVGGNTISTNGTSYTQIISDDNGTMYIAYADESVGGNLTVQSYDPSLDQRSLVGGVAGISSGAASFISMTIDKNAYNKLYIAYRDESIGGKTAVKTRDGVERTSVGDSLGISMGSSSDQSITSMPDLLVLAYHDLAQGGGTTVLLRDGFSRFPAGAENFGGGSFNTYQNAIVDAFGNVCIAYSSEELNQEAALQCRNGAERAHMGIAGEISEGAASYISTTTDIAGNIYLAFIDEGLDNILSVKKWNGESYNREVIGAYISAGQAAYTAITRNVFHKLFVGYIDTALGGTNSVQTLQAIDYECTVEGDNCVGTIAGENYITVTIEGPEGELAIAGAGGGTIATGQYSELGSGGYFKVIDNAGDDNGFYTTLQASDLVGQSTFFVISGQNITMHAEQTDIQTLVGVENQDLKIGNLATTPMMDTAQLFLHRDPGENMLKVGTYGVQPSLHIYIPEDAPSDTYAGSITYTLYDTVPQ